MLAPPGAAHAGRMNDTPYPHQRSRADRARSHNQELGASGEALAAAYLEGLGYHLLDRNWRSGREGELDLVARDGDQIVAVEVKTRSGVAAGHPLEAITAGKARRLRRLLLTWVRERHPRARALRIDAVGIVLRPGREPSIHHVQGIA